MERNAFETHMNEQTQLRNEKNCSLFQYESDVCNDGHKQIENPVLTKVSFRENNHFIDTNQLSDEIQPKKRHIGEGKVHPATSKVFTDVQTGIRALDELALAQRLLDRIERITINHMVIDLHPVKRTDTVPKQELGDSQIEVDESEP